MNIYLDAKHLSRCEEAHAYLKTQFGFPEHYGSNLDALHDCLSEMTDVDIYIENHEEGDGYYKRIYRIISHLANEEPEFRLHIENEGADE